MEVTLDKKKKICHIKGSTGTPVVTIPKGIFRVRVTASGTAEVTLVLTEPTRALALSINASRTASVKFEAPSPQLQLLSLRVIQSGASHVRIVADTLKQVKVKLSNSACFDCTVETVMAGFAIQQSSSAVCNLKYESLITAPVKRQREEEEEEEEVTNNNNKNKKRKKTPSAD